MRRFRLAALDIEEAPARPRPGVVGIERERAVEEALGAVEVGREQHGRRGERGERARIVARERRGTLDQRARPRRGRRPESPDQL